MVNVRFLVTDFASHKIWAEGYQRYSWNQDSRSSHEVRVNTIPSDRWKFRMMAAAAELESHIAVDDDIVVVDAMIDVTVLVSLLKSNRPPHQCPIVLVYCHENQLTTPFSSQDRDMKNQTHWHYGVAHYRSLLVADGFIFNSETHFEAFRHALPKLLNEQCPRDTVAWHLERCQKLLTTKCVVLQYGLDLEGLMDQDDHDMDRSDDVPIILWNARLDEDKDPGTFIAILQQIHTKASFKLIILGDDSTHGQKWYKRLQHEFGARILYMGWCTDRSEYARWLRKASIVVSTANHETFGISIVESVWCGALPLLPNRLSYPELFWELGGVNGIFVYKSIQDACEKLLHLLCITTSDPQAYREARLRTQATAARFRWEVMGPVYDLFFFRLAQGLPIVDASCESPSLRTELNRTSAANVPSSLQQKEHKPGFIEWSIHTVTITDEDDSRVQLFRPKSLRNHQDYHRQWSRHRENGVEVSLHGGRRAMIRMLEAIQTGAKINPICFLMTDEVANAVFRDVNRLRLKSCDDITVPNESTPLYLADKELLNKIRGQKVNAGDAILAIVQFPIASKLENLIDMPPILILENVRNAENVGSILRTAFCLGITSVVASGAAWSAVKDSRAARCSMGTMYYHRYYKVDDHDDNVKSNCLVTSINTIRKAGIRVYGIEIGENSKVVAPHRKDRGWAVVLGNEDVGLSSEVATACDEILFIPQVHGDSLNVGHAAAIVLYELGRDGPVPQHDGLAACS